MTQIDPKDLEAIWPEDDYERHDITLSKNEEESNTRYLNWLDAGKATLFDLYRARLDEGDKEALSASWPTWGRLMFLRYDLNQLKHTQSIDDQKAIDDMIRSL